MQIYAEYVTPAFEKLSFNHIVERLITVGYPEEIRKFEYVPHFPVRCVRLQYSCYNPRLL